jgi:phenylpropionate dioxygenase-like ring-hydroxylating dioxygenase large terminal subunit
MNHQSQPNKKPLIADINTPLLHNFWYVAGYTSDFSRELVERTFLNRSIVFYRTEKKNELVALQNRCAHRSYPLAESWLEGDDIRCGYHGAKFNPTGEIIEIPCQDKCPSIQAVQNYPVCERGPLVWIWMGEADDADESKIPDTSWLNTEDGWVYTTGTYHIEGNYMLMMENLMDLTHIPFLHGGTLAFDKSYAKEKFELEIDDIQVTYSRRPDGEYHRYAFFPDYMVDQFEGREYESRSGGCFVQPGMNYGIQELRLKHPKKGEQKEYIGRIPHFVTPESESTCHYWFFHTRQFAVDDASFTDQMKETLISGFKEDQDAIRLIQNIQTSDQTAYQEINFAADKPTIAMRKIVQKLANEEYPELEG